MTQEEKELLLKDLCARLPYKTHVYMKIGKTNVIDDIVLNGQYIHDWITNPSCQNIIFKPYLRPLSSMTDDEFEEISNLWNDEFDKALVLSISGGWKRENINRSVKFLEFLGASKVIDALDKHLFDHRGLIPKGLALEATKDMYKKGE